jgi:hypothetical protein
MCRNEPNLNVTHTDDWIRNNARVVSLPIIAIVMTKPHVWNTTPKHTSDSGDGVCTFSWCGGCRAGWGRARRGIRRQMQWSLVPPFPFLVALWVSLWAGPLSTGGRSNMDLVAVTMHLSWGPHRTRLLKQNTVQQMKSAFTRAETASLLPFLMKDANIVNSECKTSFPSWQLWAFPLAH